jgi:hypothetical protein
MRKVFLGFTGLPQNCIKVIPQGYRKSAKGRKARRSSGVEPFAKSRNKSELHFCRCHSLVQFHQNTTLPEILSTGMKISYFNQFYFVHSTGFVKFLWGFDPQQGMYPVQSI